MGGPASEREGTRSGLGGPAQPRLGLGGGFSPPFIGSEKRVLRRVLGEKGVILTAEAQARLDALPERFLDFIAAPVSFATQLEAKAA